MCSLGWFQIHRCRIIWNSYRAIVVPIILWLATLSEHRPYTTPCSCFIPCPLSIGSAGRMGHQCTRQRLCHRHRWTINSRILVRFGVPEHDLNVHDMSPCAAAWQEGPGTPWARIRVFIFHCCHDHHRICASIHALWHCRFGGVGGGESDFADVHLCVCFDDGAWFCHVSCNGVAKLSATYRSAYHRRC